MMFIGMLRLMSGVAVQQSAGRADREPDQPGRQVADVVTGQSHHPQVAGQLGGGGDGVAW